jgi:hypothetical protein
MRSIFSYFAFISVFLFLAGCAGESGQRRSAEAPAYGTADPYGNTISGRQYGPQDRAGNQVQNGLPPWSGCQNARC